VGGGLNAWDLAMAEERASRDFLAEPAARWDDVERLLAAGDEGAE
jgi:hypothetical protein